MIANEEEWELPLCQTGKSAIFGAKTQRLPLAFSSETIAPAHLLFLHQQVRKAMKECFWNCFQRGWLCCVPVPLQAGSFCTPSKELLELEAAEPGLPQLRSNVG